MFPLMLTVFNWDSNTPIILPQNRTVSIRQNMQNPIHLLVLRVMVLLGLGFGCFWVFLCLGFWSFGVLGCLFFWGVWVWGFLGFLGFVGFPPTRLICEELQASPFCLGLEHVDMGSSLTAH